MGDMSSPDMLPSAMRETNFCLYPGFGQLSPADAKRIGLAVLVGSELSTGRFVPTASPDQIEAFGRSNPASIKNFQETVDACLKVHGLLSPTAAKEVEIFGGDPRFDREAYVRGDDGFWHA